MKIAVAMSGGIDSSVTALILKEAGHDLIGVTALLSDSSKLLPENASGNFNSTKSVEDAAAVCQQIGIEHKVINLETDFEKQIIKPFCDSYLRGETPSPCIRCNAFIKFSKLNDYVKSIGYDYIATGHYSSIKHDIDTDKYFLKAAKDEKKDQSYFLFMLSQETLASTLFPLGDYSKDEIRDIAKSNSLSIADKPDSQEICFIPDDDYKSFIMTYTGIKPHPGKIVNSEGVQIGEHNGIFNYTIGQRRGLGISADRPLYVTSINPSENLITAGYKEELLKKGLIAEEISFMKADSFNGTEAYIKTRSTQKKQKAVITSEGNVLKAVFSEPMSQITPGQAVVIYNEKDEILGGAWIKSSF